ncbi:MAG: chloride channel protein [Alphaproteobacteria bacterium]|nr:MAG: chloride channel protein [Alphaproteobacteria bacterium]
MSAGGPRPALWPALHLGLFWLLALVMGVVAGHAAVAFRLAISALQTLFYGADDRMLASHLAGADPLAVIGIPVLGGLTVGLLMWRFSPDGRVHVVAQVIEAAALREGRVRKRVGLASALASLVTLSTGGSTGREGPAVHLAAVISSWAADRLRADAVTARDLLGCAVAAAVSASFNAPIAGAIFAHEVVLRHFALHALAPITIAAVAGAVVSRVWLGDVPEFVLHEPYLGFYAELPAFLILGVVAGLVAVVMVRAIFLANDLGDVVQGWLRLPVWLRPMVAGALLGLIALWFPHIIGVGYETTLRALRGEFAPLTAVAMCAVKVAAVAVTLGGRMGGGVFSPALMVGALTGLAFGEIATGLVPQLAGGTAIYALAGMGAVAGAVLGAPISSSLIIFEMTGDWQTAIAVMLSVSTASALAGRMIPGSFFLAQLERARMRLRAGPADYLPRMLAVRPLARPVDPAERGTLSALAARGLQLQEGATLEDALPMFRAGGPDRIPLTRPGAQGPEIVAVLHEADALRAYAEALARAAREEHL